MYLGSECDHVQMRLQLPCGLLGVAWSSVRGGWGLRPTQGALVTEIAKAFVRTRWHRSSIAMAVAVIQSYVFFSYLSKIKMSQAKASS